MEEGYFISNVQCWGTPRGVVGSFTVFVSSALTTVSESSILEWEAKGSQSFYVVSLWLDGFIFSGPVRYLRHLFPLDIFVDYSESDPCNAHLHFLPLLLVTLINGAISPGAPTLFLLAFYLLLLYSRESGSHLQLSFAEASANI